MYLLCFINGSIKGINEKAGVGRENKASHPEAVEGPSRVTSQHKLMVEGNLLQLTKDSPNLSH